MNEAVDTNLAFSAPLQAVLSETKESNSWLIICICLVVPGR
ncbi:MAG: hypothetical protein AVDCRST_MAG93-8816 [uncultured Chloroflexia bacterium]|uniref:Uncharacterized protein n=1 Tax=uncultured Chloroflexia bacterium TaxID=1672391 RepID=A0A6J4N308_9CHLR|nr:MAG: hypothetical protein AVDCRST_MAG93-8816 [uncultured Chloroflexia bacterium]